MKRLLSLCLAILLVGLSEFEFKPNSHGGQAMAQMEAAVLMKPELKNVDKEDELDFDNIEWWKKTNFYHIYVRSFKDSTGDGNGDLRGVIEKLDYLKEIGVGTILMAPFYSSPMKDCGYDIDDYYGINPMFGNMSDYDELVAQVRRRKMHIVVDFVPNHSSDKHFWFQCSERALLEPERCGKYKDYYVWSDSKRYQGKYPSNWVSVFGGGPAWTWSEVRKQFYLHQFLPQQPDLNFHNPQVREEFKEIARFWLRKSDGLRVDSAIFLVEDDVNFADEPPNEQWRGGDDPADRLDHVHTRCLHESAEIVKDWREVAQEAEFKGTQKVIITEAYDKIPKLIEYYGTGPADKYADLPFNFELFKLNSNNMHSAKYIRQVLLNWISPARDLNWPNEFGSMSPWIIWVTGNHDNKRLVNRVGRQYITIFKWLAHLMPGVAVNYYGDELPLHDSNFNSIPQRTIDEGEPTRLPFRAPIAWTSEQPSGGFSSNASPWMPLNSNFNTTGNVRHLMSSRADENDNQLKGFIKLLKLRQDKMQLFTFGDLVFFDTNDDHVLAFARTARNMASHEGQGNLLMLANMNKEQSVVLRNLKPVSSASGQPVSEIFRKPVGAELVPKQAKILLVNRLESGLSTSSVEGKQVELEGLVLGPAQALLLEYF